MNTKLTTFIKVIFSSLLIGLCWACSKSYPNSLARILGAPNAHKVEVIEAFNKSTFNDTVLIWRLSHSSVDAIRLRAELKVQESDIGDLEYAKSELKMLKAKDIDIFARVYRSEVNDFDIYWMFNSEDDKSILIGYQY